MKTLLIENWNDLNFSAGEDKILSRVLSVFVPKVLINDKFLYIKYEGDTDKKSVAYQYFLKYKDFIETSINVSIRSYKEIDMERLMWVEQVVKAYEPSKIEVNLFNG